MVVAAGERLRQGDDVGVRRRVEAGKAGIDVEVDAGARDRPPSWRARVRGAQTAPTSRDERVRVVGGDGAELEQDLAAVRHDVERRAAVDHADMAGRVRARRRARPARLRARVLPPIRLISATSRAPNSTALTPWGASEEWQVAPRTVAAHAALALVADDDPHAGRLADEAGLGPDRPLPQALDEVPRTDAADLLVIGEGEMDAAAERPLAICGAAARQTARKPFMSQAPRP